MKVAITIELNGEAWATPEMQLDVIMAQLANDLQNRDIPWTEGGEEKPVRDMNGKHVGTIRFMA